MYRCQTCVSVVLDTTVRRCSVCGENFKRHPPKVLGAERRGIDKLTAWDIRAHAPLIDLPKEHLRDRSGRTAGAERG
jgi:hypothetical protein